MAEAAYEFVTYETLDEGTIARIMLNRPEARNAQHRKLLVELNEAMLRAEADDTVRVVILGGNGTMFSSGHDTGSKEMWEELRGDNPHPTATINGSAGGADACSAAGKQVVAWGTAYDQRQFYLAAHATEVWLRISTAEPARRTVPPVAEPRPRPVIAA